MKKILIIATAIFVMASCQNDLSEKIDKLEIRVNQLEELCSKINEDISSINTIVKALQANDYVTNVEPVVESGKTVGYTISFLYSDPVTIYHGKDGNDGTTPIIGVKLSDDGLYYWTANGEFLLDKDGNKILASNIDGIDGITPKLKIDGEEWYISYDNGATWENLGKASWIKNDPVFSNITVGEFEITITLANETSFIFPRYQKINISFYDEYGNKLSSDTVKTKSNHTILRYELDNCTENAIVSASSDGNYLITIDKINSNEGKITIDVSNDSEDGFINMLVYDNNGFSFTQVINLKVIHPLISTILGTYTVEGRAYQQLLDGSITITPVTWNVNFLKDPEHIYLVWIESIVPSFQGIAGFYGDVIVDDNGNILSLSVPLGQINTEYNYNGLDVFLLKAFEPDEEGKVFVTDKGNMVIEFSNDGQKMIYGTDGGPVPAVIQRSGKLGVFQVILPGSIGTKK